MFSKINSMRVTVNEPNYETELIFKKSTPKNDHPELIKKLHSSKSLRRLKDCISPF